MQPTIAPEMRATWIMWHAAEFNVLITNARLIEMELNLTMFSTGKPETGSRQGTWKTGNTTVPW